MDIPIELFLGFTGISIVLAIFGFLRNPQIPATIVMGGMFLLVISVATTNIIMNNRIENTDTLQEEIQIEERDYLYHIDTFTTSSVDLRQGTEARIQHFGTNSTAIGSSFQCMELYVAKSGSPSVSQLVRFGVFVGNNPSVPQTEFGTMNVTDITTAFVLYEFCLPDGQHHVISLNDRIGARWNGSADGNEILLRVDDTSNDVYESTNSRRQTWTTTWSNSNGEMTMRLYNTTTTVLSDSTNYTYQENFYEFTELPKTLFALIGVMIMLIGGLMVMRD